ncbi:ribonuclease pancreatic-like [Alligator sinensis]|uniref:Ribonuclease pancreatic-like n=1 Tax=Alligator sinensis TaxID=38654 RepID=A0A3Q0FRH6_ALLSI|nr:ribonuclease pancreatic-like [Alligator sinensis]
MAARGPCPMVLLLSALLCLCLVQFTQGASFQEFVSEHVDYPKTGGAKSRSYCNVLMQERGMTTTSCKPFNVFIHAPINQIRALCTSLGEHFRNDLYDSKKSFDLTVCRLVPRTFRRPCVYSSGSQTRRIRVACHNRLPVRLEQIL